MKPRNRTLEWLKNRLRQGDARVYQRTIKAMIKKIAAREKPKQRIEVRHFVSAGLKHLLN